MEKMDFAVDIPYEGNEDLLLGLEDYYDTDDNPIIIENRKYYQDFVKRVRRALEELHAESKSAISSYIILKLSKLGNSHLKTNEDYENALNALIKKYDGYEGEIILDYGKLLYYANPQRYWYEPTKKEKLLKVTDTDFIEYDYISGSDFVVLYELLGNATSTCDEYYVIASKCLSYDTPIMRKAMLKHWWDMLEIHIQRLLAIKEQNGGDEFMVVIPFLHYEETGYVTISILRRAIEVAKLLYETDCVYFDLDRCEGVYYKNYYSMKEAFNEYLQELKDKGKIEEAWYVEDEMARRGLIENTSYYKDTRPYLTEIVGRKDKQANLETKTAAERKEENLKIKMGMFNLLLLAHTSEKNKKKSKSATRLARFVCNREEGFDSNTYTKSTEYYYWTQPNSRVFNQYDIIEAVKDNLVKEGFFTKEEVDDLMEQIEKTPNKE